MIANARHGRHKATGALDKLPEIPGTKTATKPAKKADQAAHQA
jgi:hypothetical protein